MSTRVETFHPGYSTTGKRSFETTEIEEKEFRLFEEVGVMPIILTFSTEVTAIVEIVSRIVN